MSESGKNIVDGFREIRIFCKEVSLMLITADGFMKEAGWIPWPRSSVIGNRSGAVDEPERWFPYEFSRFYKKTLSKRVLPFIAVLLDDPCIEENKTLMSEALLTAGYIDYGEKEAEIWDYWYSRSHLFMAKKEGNRLDNGKIYSALTQDIWNEDEIKGGAVRVVTFAFPLDEITDGNSLKNKIVQPLLNELNKL